MLGEVGASGNHGKRERKRKRKLGKGRQNSNLHCTVPGYLHGLFSPNTNTKGRNMDKLYIIRPTSNWLKNPFVYTELPYYGTPSAPAQERQRLYVTPHLLVTSIVI